MICMGDFAIDRVTVTGSAGGWLEAAADRAMVRPAGMLWRRASLCPQQLAHRGNRHRE
jgi:hypothetical protein